MMQGYARLKALPFGALFQVKVSLGHLQADDFSIRFQHFIRPVHSRVIF